MHEYSNRPWGYYIKLHEEYGFWLKKLVVKPLSRLSLQKHIGRYEKWIVVSGEGYAVIDSNTVKISKGSIVEIPVEAVHRIGNTSFTADLVFIEVAFGEVLSEEDIIRIEDDYERK